MLLFLLTVLNCPIINVTHCKKIHNNYCVPACIFLTEETNKHCLQNLLWYLIKQTPLMWRSQAKRMKTLVLSFFLFLTIYILILRSSFSLISSLVDFPFLLSSPSEALHPPHPELQLKIVMRKVWIARLHRGQCWIWKVITILICTWCPGWSTNCTTLLL